MELEMTPATELATTENPMRQKEVVTKQDDGLHLPVPRHVYGALGIAITLLFAGIVFGSSALIPTLRRMGVFADLCTDEGESAPCDAQDARFGLALTVSSILANLVGAFTGPVLDTAGPKVVFMGTAAVLATSVLFLIISDTGDGGFDGYMIALCMIGAPASSMLFTTFHIANLFEMRFFYLALVNSSFDASTLVFGIIATIVSSTSVELSEAVLVYFLAIAVPIVIAGAVLMPWKSFPDNAYDTFSKRVAPAPAESLDVESLTPKKHVARMQSQAAARESMAFKPFQTLSVGECFRHPLFWAFAAFFSVGVLRLFFMLSSTDSFLNDLGQENGSYTQLLGLILPIGGLFWPWITGPIVERYGVTGGAFALCFASLVMEGTRLVPILELQPLGFVAVTMFRALQFALLPSFLGSVFGFNNLGTLIGACAFLSSVFSSLQYALVLLGVGMDSFLVPNLITTGLTIACFAFPLYVRSFVNARVPKWFGRNGMHMERFQRPQTSQVTPAAKMVSPKNIARVISPKARRKSQEKSRRSSQEKSRRSSQESKHTVSSRGDGVEMRHLASPHLKKASDVPLTAAQMQAQINAGRMVNPLSHEARRDLAKIRAGRVAKEHASHASEKKWLADGMRNFVAHEDDGEGGRRKKRRSSTSHTARTRAAAASAALVGSSRRRASASTAGSAAWTPPAFGSRHLSKQQEAKGGGSALLSAPLDIARHRELGRGGGSGHLRPMGRARSTSDGPPESSMLMAASARLSNASRGSADPSLVEAAAVARRQSLRDKSAARTVLV